MAKKKTGKEYAQDESKHWNYWLGFVPAPLIVTIRPGVHRFTQYSIFFKVKKVSVMI